MPKYLFQWTAQQSNVRITVECYASDDAEAGSLAAMALKDLTKGRLRVWDWKPSVGISKDTRV